jgi:hypothetical protein
VVPCLVNNLLDLIEFPFVVHVSVLVTALGLVEALFVFKFLLNEVLIILLMVLLHLLSGFFNSQNLSCFILRTRPRFVQSGLTHFLLVLEVLHHHLLLAEWASKICNSWLSYLHLKHSFVKFRRFCCVFYFYVCRFCTLIMVVENREILAILVMDRFHHVFRTCCFDLEGVLLIAVLSLNCTLQGALPVFSCYFGFEHVVCVHVHH